MTIAKITDYIKALETHDWEYEAASDQNVWRKGVRERVEIAKARPFFDADYALWNRYAPELLRRTAKPQNCADGEHKTSAEHRA